ncbi:MAG: ABC transporter permease subunit [Candidatus Bathyarchaeia archaeon]|nr:ABC transporter permease [Candidatus Bathyarchaeota archaeon]
MRITPIIRKEVADHLSSRRFPLLIALVLLSGLATSYLGVQSIVKGPIKETEQTIAFLRLLTGSEETQIPSYVYFIGLFGPIVGIALSFDSVNREVSSGSMLKLLSNPIYRDSIILGKIIAGILIILLIVFSSTGIVTGFNILLAGFGPTIEGTFRIIYFAIASFLYIALWFSIGLLFSIVFRRTTTSALASLAVWVFFSIFIYLVADIIATEVAGLRYYFPEPPTSAKWLYYVTYDAVIRFSPQTLYSEVAGYILSPEILVIYFNPYGGFYLPSLKLRPLSLDESLSLVWPSFSTLIASFVIILTLSILIFLKMEVRPSWA